MNADVLLSRLGGVRSAGPDAWRADCPNGHEHAHGSLSIKANADGTILLHCFACGDVSGILGAVGLTLGDLFPERIKPQTFEERRAAREAFKRASWAAALRVLSREALTVAAAAGMLREGRPLSADDDVRLTVALQRINDARAVLA